MSPVAVRDEAAAIATRLRTARAALRLEAIDDALLGAMAAAMAETGRIDPWLCGTVYERRLAGDRRRRRAGGAYYTPPHLVDFVVERTVGRALARGADPLGLRVVDLACGGGAFLLGVVDRIATACPAAGGAAGAALRRRIAEECVVGVELDPVAAQVCRLALSLASSGASAPIVVADALLDDDALAAAGITDGAVDAVVGNPPWGQKGFRFPAAVAARLRARYATATGVLDPFKLFVERAVGLLRSGGRWGMVLPDIVLLKDQQPLRHLLLARCALEHIADAGRVFPGVNLDAVVITARRAAPPPRHRIAIWHRLPLDWRRSAPPTVRLAQAVFTRLPGQRFNLHLTAASLALLERLESLPRLGDRFEVHEGVHTGNARARLFCAVRPAGAAARVVVGGAELGRFRLDWAGTWLDLDPAAIDRVAGGYANLGRPAWHRAGKLVVRRTGDRIVCARDRVGLWVSNNAFVVVPRAPMPEAELAAWTALLASAAITWWFRTVQPRTGRLFAELKIQHLVCVPRPEGPAWRRAVPVLARLATRAERCARDRDAAGLAVVDEAIDAAVARAFAFDAAERALIATTAVG